MRISTNKIYLFLVVILLPLIFWSGSSDNTGQIKWYFWAVIGSLYLIVIAKKLVLENWEFRVTYLTLILFSFIILAVISIMGAVNKIYAIKSILLFCLLVQVYLVSNQTELDWLIARNTLQFSTLIICFYGIVQTFLPLFSGNKRYYPISTLGNPNFTGEFLVPIFILILAKLLANKSNWQQKWYDVLGSLVIFFTIILTFSSAALLALIIAAAFVFIVSFRQRWLKFTLSQKAFSLTGIGLALCSLFLVFSFTSFLRPSFSNLSWENRNTRFRYYTYGSTIEMFQHNFWLGIGFNNFEFIYPSFRKQADIDLNDPDIITDKAHNEYLQWASEIGILGVIIEICFLFWLFTLMKKTINQPVYWGISGAIIAMLVQAAFGFNLHNAATAALFFFLLGQLAQKTEKPLLIWTNPLLSLNAAAKAWFITIILGIAGLSLFFSVRLASSDHYLAKGSQLEAANENKALMGISEYEKAYKLNPTSLDIAYHLARALTEKGQINEATAIYQKILPISPYYLPILNNLGINYGILEQWSEAEKIFLLILKLDGKNLKALSNLANCYQLSKQQEKAIAALRQFLKIDPQHKVSHYNLGAILEETNQWEEAIKTWEEYLKLTSDRQEYERVAAHILQLKSKISN